MGLDIQKWFTSNRGQWWFLLLCIGITWFLQWLITQPKTPDIKITYYWIETVPYKKPEAKIEKDSREMLHIDYGEDKNIYGIGFDLVNSGSKEARNFEIYFNITNNNIKIIKLPTSPESSFWKYRVIDADDTDTLFYRKFSTFPRKAEMSLEFILSAPVSKKDLKMDFTCDFAKWTPKCSKIKIRQMPVNSQTRRIMHSSAYAEDLVKEPVKKKREAISGILIGGYDPLILTNNLFDLIQDKGILDYSEALTIKETVEQYKEGVLFGGVNILKFNELVLNALLRKKIISMDEANSIVEKSKNAGGVLISGYNVIILETEILNVLFKKGYINFTEGQMAIDSAKPTLLKHEFE